MKEINILWVDCEHVEHWSPHFQALEEAYDIKIEVISSFKAGDVVGSCKDKNAIVIHCGTLNPMAGIKGLLKNIKNKYPDIKIGLEANVLHPNLKNLVDFYVNKPILPEELQSKLREEIE